MCIWQKSALLIAVLAAGCVQSDLAPGVSPSAIKAVRLGMNLDEVINTLGVPHSLLQLHGTHSGTCRAKTGPSQVQTVTSKAQIRALLHSTYSATPCCAGNQQDLDEGRFVLIYSRMVQGISDSHMLYVHFKDGAYVQVVAASINSTIPGREEVGVYTLNEHAPLFCKEELLRKYFSQ
jgi:hypothetical protein